MSQLSPSAFSFHEESVPAAATGRDACVLDERCVEPAYRPGKRPHSQKESLQVSASSGEMQVRPQNCTGTNSSLNLVLITTWVLTEQPEECNPAHPVAARWSARNQRNVEEGQPPSRRVLLGPYCFPENQAGFPSQGPTRITPIPFLGLGVLLIKRACGPRKSWPDWLKPASCTVLLPLTSSPPTGQTTPALGHQLGGPTERKLCKASWCRRRKLMVVTCGSGVLRESVRRNILPPHSIKRASFVLITVWAPAADVRDFRTLSSVTMRLLQVVLAAVFIIFQLPPRRSTLKDPVTCVVESA
ncbi:uncharacterized protein LOC125164466 isoform X10 [Prionailurus viverrinus]|uniref:uncharacterized protein LOC125164466 isoform X10 n=1 Tax=Prionailurus viverrinus TaxID=61388 RepID=UPI001FF2F61F|nr:uncharacterized protein LOC125164466 isoform X10 [Prionailurus viverrinus]